MPFVLRFLKRGYFVKGQFRKYTIYAIGEMALVIVGILVALQIDNWNTERQEEATLKSYLASIARNQRADLTKVNSLNAEREDAMLNAIRVDGTILNRASLDVDDIFFFNKAAMSAQKLLYFRADKSGYEALKSSGVLDRLQGRDIETLLSAYYDTVSQIENYEEDFNDVIREIALRFNLDMPPDVESYAFMNPSALAPQRFESLQSEFSQRVNGPLARALILSHLENYELLRQYGKLMALGLAYNRMVEAGSMEFDAAMLDEIRDRDVRAGDSTIIEAGRLNLRSYYLGQSSSIGGGAFGLDSLQPGDSSLRLAYDGGAEWASFYITLLAVDEGRASLDYSKFDRLVLELKGEVGGETIRVAIKDRDDRDDEAPPSVDVTLSDTWQTYEIGLASFLPADLEALHLPLAFVFERDMGPVAFSVRSARYVASQ
jgi:hypothetical protein